MANKVNEDTNVEKQEMNDLINELGSLFGEGSGDTPVGPEIPTGPNGNPLLSTVTDTNHPTDQYEDEKGNIVTVPKGFKVVEGTAGEEITVQNGVVIEDSAGNQFVWIPVGQVTLNDGTTKKRIDLGRYIFSESMPGLPTLEPGSYQYAYTEGNLNNYENEAIIGSCYQELKTERQGSASVDGLNATAKNLKGFVDSVRNNGGYYLARYEASYGSGTTSADYKPLSKPSTIKDDSTNTFVIPTAGTTGIKLWNAIRQTDAAMASRNMYAGNKDASGNTVGVESDLVNSYAWDTAIMYIQLMNHTNFANITNLEVRSTALANTGSNSIDKFCNIYDMVANETEWNTEYSNATDGSSAYHCVLRGSSYSASPTASNTGTAGRNHINAPYTYSYFGFRPILYVTN